MLVHTAVIADDDEFAGAQLLFGEVPFFTADYIRFVERLTVDQHLAIHNRDAFPGEPDDAFHKQVADACGLDADHVAALGWAGSIRQAIEQVDAAIAVGRCHAESLYPHRSQDKSKENESDECQQARPDQGHARIAPEDEPPGETGLV